MKHIQKGKHGETLETGEIVEEKRGYKGLKPSSNTKKKKKAGESGILKISFRAVTCTMSAAAAGKVILSRDPEGFWRISANPVPHSHCRQLHTCTPPTFTSINHRKLEEYETKCGSRALFPSMRTSSRTRQDELIRCTFKTRAPWTEQHAAHATSTLVAVVKYCSGMYRNKYYK